MAQVHLLKVEVMEMGEFQWGIDGMPVIANGLLWRRRERCGKRLRDDSDLLDKPGRVDRAVESLGLGRSYSSVTESQADNIHLTKCLQCVPSAYLLRGRNLVHYHKLRV